MVMALTAKTSTASSRRYVARLRSDLRSRRCRHKQLELEMQEQPAQLCELLQGRLELRAAAFDGCKFLLCSPTQNCVVKTEIPEGPESMLKRCGGTRKCGRKSPKELKSEVQWQAQAIAIH